MKRLHIVNAVLLLPLGYGLIRFGDSNIRSAAMQSAYEQGFSAYVADVMVGIFVVVPLSILITAFLLWRFKEPKTLSNVLSVFGTAFGVLSGLYFLWTLRY